MHARAQKEGAGPRGSRDLTGDGHPGAAAALRPLGATLLQPTITSKF